MKILTVLAIYAVALVLGYEPVKRLFKIKSNIVKLVCSWLFGAVLIFIIHKTGLQPLDLQIIVYFVVLTFAINSEYRLELIGLKVGVKKLYHLLSLDK